MADMRAMLRDRSTKVAVVGATDTAGKYGGIIYRDLKTLGYRVFAVNPGRGTVDGDRAYPDLQSLPERVDIVNFVVPPAIGRQIAEEAVRLDYDHLWFQPGAGDPNVTRSLEERGAEVFDGPCIMVLARHQAAV